MGDYDDRQYVELFHLLFLDFLGRKLDKRNYVLKGGCNLRFFMKSFRYSEDIDFDVLNISKERLGGTVNAILKSRTFAQVLEVHGMVLSSHSAPKQTETTQRWKMLIEITGYERPLNTKAEFSRRGAREAQAFESIDPLVIRAYALAPIMANHYTPQTACRQKVEALICRSTTQARDIFDLHLLLASGIDMDLHDFKLKARLDEAASNAMSVTFDMFRSQVFAYLHADQQARYDSEAVWDGMVLQVVSAIERGLA